MALHNQRPIKLLCCSIYAHLLFGVQIVPLVYKFHVLHNSFPVFCVAVSHSIDILVLHVAMPTTRSDHANYGSLLAKYHSPFYNIQIFSISFWKPIHESFYLCHQHYLDMQTTVIRLTNIIHPFTILKCVLIRPENQSTNQFSQHSFLPHSTSTNTIRPLKPREFARQISFTILQYSNMFYVILKINPRIDFTSSIFSHIPLPPTLCGLSNYRNSLAKCHSSLYNIQMCSMSF